MNKYWMTPFVQNPNLVQLIGNEEQENGSRLWSDKWLQQHTTFRQRRCVKPSQSKIMSADISQNTKWAVLGGTPLEYQH